MTADPVPRCLNGLVFGLLGLAVALADLATSRWRKNLRNRPGRP